MYLLFWIYHKFSETQINDMQDFLYSVLLETLSGCTSSLFPVACPFLDWNVALMVVKTLGHVPHGCGMKIWKIHCASQNAWVVLVD